MPITDYSFKKGGDYYDATADTDITDAIDTLVAAGLTSTELGDGAIDVFNLNHTASSTSPWQDYSAQTGSSAAYSDVVREKVDHGTGGRLTYVSALNLLEGDVVRLHANVMITTVTVSASSGSPEINDEYFLGFGWNDGTNDLDVGPEWGYSMQERNVGGNEGVDTDLGGGSGENIQYFRAGFSWCFVVPANISISSVSIWCRVADATNTVNIAQYSLSLIVQRS